MVLSRVRSSLARWTFRAALSRSLRHHRRWAEVAAVAEAAAEVAAGRPAQRELDLEP